MIQASFAFVPVHIPEHAAAYAIDLAVYRPPGIRNDPGIPEASGETLQAAFRAHIDEMGIGITEAMVNSILPMGDHYAVIAGPDFYETKTVILTTGVAQTGTLPGESE